MTHARGLQVPAASPTGLPQLVQNLEGEQRFVEVIRALARGESATIDGAWGSACALCAVALARRCPSTLVVVLPRVGDVESFAADVAAFHEARPLVFPAWDSLPEEQESADPLFAERLRALALLDAGDSSRLQSSSGQPKTICRGRRDRPGLITRVVCPARTRAHHGGRVTGRIQPAWRHR